MSRYRIGVDVGGTFTDCAVIDETTGQVATSKVPTTPDDQSRGFIDAIDGSGVALPDVSLVLHGCTVGLNAILTRGGPKIGLITTDGFRDVTAMGRGQRPSSDQFNPRWRRSYGDTRSPFVARYLRRTVRERIGSRGEVLVPLDSSELRAQVDFLAEQGVEAIAICFVNAYANDAHEKRAKALVQEWHPHLYCWTSTEVHPCFKEYPRFSTAVLNAYVGPLMARYLDRAEQLLLERGYRRPLMIMQSNGGVLPGDMTRRRPVYTIQSGPVGGVIAAGYWGKQLALEELLTLDIGGTSADYSIIRGGQPLVTTELELEHDVIVALPAVDVHSIGAGGGSIAWIDHLQALRVGPQSAGAVPGPACYGLGGVNLTVTDALVVAGVLRPEFFLGGKLPLYPENARKALEPIAAHLGASIEQAAGAVLDVAVANLVEGAREISVFNGVDPRDFVLYAFGAAGPLFASRIGRELEVQAAVLPPFPGEMCAYGLAMADVRVDLGEPIVRLLDEMTPEELTAMYRGLEEQAGRVLAGQLQGPGAAGTTVVQRWLDGRYQGQTWETPSVPAPSGDLDAAAISTLRTNFHDTHQRHWGYALRHAPIKATMARITAVVPFSRPEAPRRQRRDGAGRPAPVGSVQAFLGGWRDVPVFARDSLQPGDALEGPAIVTQPTSTILLTPEDTARLDEHDHLWITWR